MTQPYPTRAVGQAGPIAYLSGFGNGFETEALPGALPIGRNSPQRCAYGLYAEQLSGSPFTAPRASNERSWLYRIRPTLQHWGHFEKVESGPMAHRSARGGRPADRTRCAGILSRCQPPRSPSSRGSAPSRPPAMPVRRPAWPRTSTW